MLEKNGTHYRRVYSAKVNGYVESFEEIEMLCAFLHVQEKGY